MKYVFLGLVGLVAIGALIALIWAVQYNTARLRGTISAREQILSGSNRIVAYNHFFDLCAGIRASEAALDAQFNQLEVTTDSFQKTRVQTNITGLKGHRASLIEQYNFDARKNYTVGQFRDLELPYQLQNNEFGKGVRTQC